MRFNRSLEEHIRLAFQFAIFIDDFKSWEQSIGAVVGKGGSIGTAVNQSVLLCKSVIQCIQLILCLFDFAVGVILCLQFNQVADAIPYPRVCRDRIIFFLQFIGNFVFGDFSVNVWYCFVQKLRKVGVFKRLTGCFRSEATAYHFHFAEYHFRVLNKKWVHSYTVFVGVKMNPVRLNIYEPVSLLQKQNIGYDLCPGIAFEGVIRKSDCSE